MSSEIRIELGTVREAINGWPSDIIKNEQDTKIVLDLTDKYFQKIEHDLINVLGKIQSLNSAQQKEFTKDVHDLKILVEHKFKHAEQELKEVKARMDSGRIHAKAIRAYAQI